MSPRFQLVFREDGKRDRAEYHYKNGDGSPHIEGNLIIDGHRYMIRGIEWLVSLDGNGHHDGDGKHMPRYVCTLVVRPE